MKPYDRDAKCPKCGHDLIKATYHSGIMGGGSVCPPQEHMHRACRCGYHWAEAPLDAKADP